MRYVSIPITERTKRIRKSYLEMPVPQENNPYIDKKYRRFCTGDRWITLGFLEGWYKYSSADTTRLRRSYAEAEELYQAQPIITEDELLVGHLYLPEYTKEEQKRYDELCEMFEMSPYTLKERGPRIDHLSLDFEKLLKCGINGIKAEILEKKKALDYEDEFVYPQYEVIKKHEFYQCCLIELDAVLDLAHRYAEKAKAMADEAEEERREELLTIYRILQKVPAEPAETFYEAIQSIQFFLSTLFGLYPINRPDRYLWEYYKRDLEQGSITREKAQELIDNFCLHISTRVFSRAACGFMVGGQDENNNLVENDLTYMFLTALEHLRLPDPNGALAVNKNTSDELLEYAAEIVSKGVTHPAFYNDDAIVHSLEEYGCSKADAVNYIHTTCAEITVVGKSRAHTTAFRVDLPRLLAETVKENPDCTSYEELEQKYFKNILMILKKEPLYYLTRMLEVSRNGNEPMRVCCLVSDCLERGKGIFEGGERYSFIQPIFVGFANAVDSLLAIKELVYHMAKLSLKEFTEICDNDYKDNESLRQYIINKLPHYGNDDLQADEIASKLGREINRMFKEEAILAGKNMMPGTFSYINHSEMGAQMGATYDGRQAGYSYSDGCSPAQGRDRNGPTAMILSLTSWEQKEFLSGMVVNIKFGAESLKGEKKQQFIQLLRTFISRGGLEMQVNVVDKKELQDAKINPEQHQDLIVRIGGYSDYFVRLDSVLQQEIIDRTEY